MEAGDAPGPSLPIPHLYDGGPPSGVPGAFLYSGIHTKTRYTNNNTREL